MTANPASTMSAISARLAGSASHGYNTSITVHLPNVEARGCQKLRGQKRIEIKNCIQLWSGQAGSSRRNMGGAVYAEDANQNVGIRNGEQPSEKNCIYSSNSLICGTPRGDIPERHLSSPPVVGAGNALDEVARLGSSRANANTTDEHMGR